MFDDLKKVTRGCAEAIMHLRVILAMGGKRNVIHIDVHIHVGVSSQEGIHDGQIVSLDQSEGKGVSG